MKYALTSYQSHTTRVLHLAHIAKILNKHIRTLKKYIKYDGYYEQYPFLVTLFEEEPKNNDKIRHTPRRNGRFCSTKTSNQY